MKYKYSFPILTATFFLLISLCTQSTFAENHISVSQKINSSVSTSAPTTMDSSTTQTVYFNNRDTGKYLHSTGSSANTVSNTLAYWGQTIQWILTESDDGSYTIRSASDPSLYLAAYTSLTSSRIFLITLSDNELTDRYKWDISNAYGGGVLIQNVHTGKYLMNSGTSLTSRNSTGGSTSTGYYAFVWRQIATAEYGNSSAYYYQEMPAGYKINTLYLFSGDVGKPTLQSDPDYLRIAWKESYDFTYSGYDSNYVSYDPLSGQFSALSSSFYNTTITATHKPTGRTATFTLVTNPKAITVGIPDTGHDHSSALENIDDILINSGYSNVTDLYNECTHTDIEYYLNEDIYNVFISRSHGNIVLSNGNEIATCIVLSRSDSSEQHLFESRDIYSTFDLSNLKLAMFIGCYTAYDVSDGTNLPEAAVNAGAKTAVGFSDSINCQKANQWTIRLFEYLDEGYNLQAALNLMKAEEEDAAIDEFGDPGAGSSYVTISDLVVIYGYKYITINSGAN